MTKEEFDTTRWYKGIKVKPTYELFSVGYEVETVDFEENTVGFWDHGIYKVLPYYRLEIIK